jgi:hypothetical protein
MTAVRSPVRGRSLLEAWLTMLGWQVEIERDGRVYVGVARHVARDGTLVVVGACAPSPPAVIWQLFDRAIRKLDRVDIEPEISSRQPTTTAA